MSDDIYNRRVAGKVVTIKCRQCSTPIRVDGRHDAPSAAPPPPSVTPPIPEAPVVKEAPPPATLNDPLDPFSLPAPDDAPPPVRAPLPSLDEVVSSAPHIPTALTDGTPAPMPVADMAPQAPPSPPSPVANARPAPPAPPPRAPAPTVPGVAGLPVAPSAPEAVAAPPAPPPRAAASAPESANPFLPVDAAPAAPVPAAPVPAAPMAAAAAPVAAPVAPQVAVDLPGPAPLPDVGLDPATLRDPHAAFRRRSPRTLILAAAAAVVMGGVIYVASSGEEKKAATRAPNVTSESAKPAIGVSVAPYRSDAHETLPGKPASAGDAPSRNEDTTGQPAAEVGSSKDFAERFKAASGRE